MGKNALSETVEVKRMTNEKMECQEARLLMVGFTVPDKTMEEICRVDPSPQVQSHKHSWNIIRGLEEHAGTSVDLLSSLPITTFPGSRRLFVGYHKWDRENGSTGVCMPFVNLLVLRHITRFVACFVFTCRWLLRNRRSKERLILLYNLHTAHTYAVLLASRLSGAKIVSIVADPPGGQRPREWFLRRMLRRFDNWLHVRGMRAMDGQICLTSQLATEYAPRVPVLVVEGVIAEDSLDHPDEAPHSELRDREAGAFVVMYAGQLVEKFGIQMLLDAFSLIRNSDYRLWLFGKGAMEKTIRDACIKDKRITYWGFVPNDIILQKSQEATLLINPRPSNHRFTRFSFPSKLLEYMTSGRPVVTTILPGIPSEYHPHLYLLEDETARGLADLLKSLHDRPRSELNKRGQRAKHFVLQKKTCSYQGERIWRFLQSVLVS